MIGASSCGKKKCCRSVEFLIHPEWLEWFNQNDGVFPDVYLITALFCWREMGRIGVLSLSNPTMSGFFIRGLSTR